MSVPRVSVPRTKKAKIGVQMRFFLSMLFFCFGVMICKTISFHTNHAKVFDYSSEEHNFIQDEKDGGYSKIGSPAIEQDRGNEGGDDDDRQEEVNEEYKADENKNADDGDNDDEEGEVIQDKISDGGDDDDNDDESQVPDYRQETNVFKQVLKRITLTNHTCKNLPEHHLGPPPVKDFDTGVPPLPENGAFYALKDWVDKESEQKNDRKGYPMCELPPVTECDVDQVTVILMSHTLDDDERLQTMTYGIAKLRVHPDVAEVVLVWNAERSTLENSDKQNAQRLLKWANDDKNPVRIFYSLENGLGNNLLNRYHPAIKPSQKVVLFFDDDGPFFGKGVMDVGFQLWRRNSDVQCGSMTRNVRFHSERMIKMNIETQSLAMKQYGENAWQTHIHPYDTSAVEVEMASVGADSPNYPAFTPICHEETGDLLEYNFFTFPAFNSHMSLPSGSFLHRNYLCFIWHPAFEELRQFILDHPTHPDDMTISTIVSHLSGKPIRTFPRRIAQGAPPQEDDHEKRRQLRSAPEEIGDDKYIKELHEDAQHRRKLLWQQKDWAQMREEAINSVVGYFGSINSGSMGWCVGTKYKGTHYHKKTKENATICDPQFPYESQIPWMNGDDEVFDQCR